MDVTAALELVRNACVAYRGTLADHQALQAALQVLATAVEPAVEAERPVPG